MLARSNEYKTLIFEPKPPGSPAVIVVAMQKWHDLDFVPPIDVPNGSHTENPYVKKRYWPIFRQASIRNHYYSTARRANSKIVALKLLSRKCNCLFAKKPCGHARRLFCSANR